MTTETSPPSSHLLSSAELEALMQRKAALQAQLRAGGASACGNNGAGACPSCQCGSSTDDDSALPTQQSRLLKIVLAALAMLALVGLVLQL